jgi:hypothetical protein
MTLAEEVGFLNKGTIVNELNKVAPGSEVTIDASNSISIDHDVWEIIQDFKKTAGSKNIQVKIITDSEGSTKVESRKVKSRVTESTVNV